MNAVHRLQDRLQQTLVLSQRRSHKTFFERAISMSKGNAAYADMQAVRQEEAMRAYDWKFAEVAEAEEAHHDAIKRTLEKTDALEKHSRPSRCTQR